MPGRGTGLHRFGWRATTLLIGACAAGLLTVGMIVWMGVASNPGPADQARLACRDSAGHELSHQVQEPISLPTAEYSDVKTSQVGANRWRVTGTVEAEAARAEVVTGTYECTATTVEGEGEAEVADISLVVDS